ncbi:predicted protein [Postia placenta Mad-698-R]|nr:predicted protein [Postia placenta Mad-698-R]
MAPYSKPEAVLKQAEGLVSVGQTHAALQSLTEMFSSKRFRSTPLVSLEPIMLRFIELCVDMRKGRTAKEGLMQYKNIAQNSSVGSIEVVISRFIQLADAKVQEAQEKADKAVALDVDDLEASETPESILLGAVSGDQNKDRTDRALVTPWLKFLWESYRTALETLKNNARLEVIYQQIAQQAFRFCLKHQRKVEFRRLCETLRLHLGNVAKYSHQPHSINLSDPDTLQHHLDTRFAQLNTSVELELWQEAFRSVEDVHNLLTMAKKAPRPAMMANYYEKLTKIFLMSGNALYHAAAWGRYYAIVTAIGGKSEEELSRLAGQVLVSALAVPVGLQGEESAVDEHKGKSSRLRPRFVALVSAAQAERKALQLRRALVARRRELLSELSVRKEKEEASRRAELTRREKEEEARRVTEEARKKEQDRARREIEIIRNEEARKLAQSLKEKGTLKVDLNDMETLSTDNLMRMQVQQLEKEKRDLNERMRVIAKRLDHAERAYRKDERPLLAKDYDIQQENDKIAFEAAQKSRLESHRLAHQHDMETKKRLSRTMSDYALKREEIVGKRSEEFAKRQAQAQKKIDEEKAKRKASILKAREEERLRIEEEERIIREKEEEERRAEAERIAEEERLAAEEAEQIAQEKAKKQTEEDARAEVRRKREEERLAAAEQARLQQQREEEASARAAARAAEKNRAPTAPPVRASVSGDSVWRSSWRERETAKKAAEAGQTVRPSSPVPRALPKEEASKNDDGFQPVEKKCANTSVLFLFRL